MITNATEYPYSLSFHAANMLVTGLIEYHRTTQRLYRTGDDPGYCHMRAFTVIKEAKKLLAHLGDVDDLSPLCRLSQPARDDLVCLLERVEKDKQKYSDADMALIKKAKKQVQPNTTCIDKL